MIRLSFTKLFTFLLALSLLNSSLVAAKIPAPFSHSHEQQRRSASQQQWVGSSFNIGGNASIKGRNGKASQQLKLKGSEFNVKETLALNADHIDIQSDQKHQQRGC